MNIDYLGRDLSTTDYLDQGLSERCERIKDVSSIQDERKIMCSRLTSAQQQLLRRRDHNLLRDVKTCVVQTNVST